MINNILPQKTIKNYLPQKTMMTRQSVNELLQSADPQLSDEDIDRAVGLLWVNAFACSNGGGQVLKAVLTCDNHLFISPKKKTEIVSPLFHHKQVWAELSPIFSLSAFSISIIICSNQHHHHHHDCHCQAIFPTFSFMSHSCAPNCAHSVFPNKTLALQVETIHYGADCAVADYEDDDDVANDDVADGEDDDGEDDDGEGDDDEEEDVVKLCCRLK